MWINVAIAYPVYIAPILFPRHKVLGLGPAFFGVAQVGLHGIAPRLRANAWYGPGFLSSALLHLPLAIAYVRALQPKGQGPVARSDYAKGMAYAMAFFAAGLGAPNFLLRDKNSQPYAFTDKQMGPYLDLDQELSAS